MVDHRTSSSRRVAFATALVAAIGVALAGCVPEPPPRQVVDVETRSVPASDDPVSTVALGGDTASAVEVSAALFESAPLVILSGGEPSRITAASTAVALGVPLFETPTDASEVRALADELDRLGSTTVVAVGSDESDGVVGDLENEGSRVVLLDASALARTFGLETEQPDADVSEVQSIAALGPHTEVILGSDAGASPSASTVSPPVPEVRHGRLVDDTAVVVGDSPVDLAATATARAAGAEVLVLPADVSDLFASAATIEALAASAPSSVLLIADQLAADPSIEWKVEVAVGGARLPGGGLRWFPEHTLVAIYGVPGSGSLGVLGEQDAVASVARAQSIAAPYVPLTGTTVVPTFEIIATVAASDAGADGDFSNEVAVETIAPWVQAAADAGMQVILDLQPGRTDFLTQAQRYEQLLRLPNVGLALDPEWRLAPDQVPLGQIGTVDAAEVNAVTTWLADLTRDNALPPKPLVLHQFRSSMIGDRAALDTSRAEVAVLIHADGQGGQPAKQATWNALRVDAPPGLAWGWKNFYDEDLPPLTPEQTMTQVVPAPSVISYQ